MKSIQVLLFCFVCFIPLGAALVKHKPVELTNSDGTKIRCFATGDEYYHRFHDADGYTLIRNSQGDYVYAAKNGDTLIPTELVPGKDSPTGKGISPNLVDDHKKLLSAEQYGSSRNGAEDPTTPWGNLFNLVVFINLSDSAPDCIWIDDVPRYLTYSYYNQMFNDVVPSEWDESLQEYFHDCSRGELTLVSHLFPLPSGDNINYVQVNHSQSEVDDMSYGDFSEMLKNAVLAIAPQIPSGWDLSGDTDGQIDNITFIINADEGNGNLWPHQFCFKEYADYGADPFYINGYRAWNYSIVMNSWGPHFTQAYAAHEMCHTFGFPDLYRENGDQDDTDLTGNWDIMGLTDGILHHPLAVTAPRVWTGQIGQTGYDEVTLSYTDPAYPIFRQLPVQYSVENRDFFVEIRNHETDPNLHANTHGVIFYRVNWDEDDSLDGPDDRIYVFGSDIDDADPLFPYNGNSSFQQFSRPAPTYYDGDTTAAPGINVFDIHTNPDNSVSFSVVQNLPKIWTGLVNDLWSEPGNWSDNAVPTDTDDVRITTSCDHRYNFSGYPHLESSPAVCHEMTIDYGANLFLIDSTLSQTDLIVKGCITMSGATSVLNVANDLLWEEDSQAVILADGPIINITGNMEICALSQLSLNHGVIAFTGSGNSYLRNYRSYPQLNNLTSNKSSGYYLYIGSGTGDSGFTINGSLLNLHPSKTVINNPQTIFINGNIVDANPDPASYIHCQAGGLVFSGSDQMIYFADEGSWLNSLQIESTGVVDLISPLATVKGNVSITSGLFNLNGHTLSVAGNWTNSAGPDAFGEAGARVAFTGNSLIGTETFNILEVKSGSLTEVRIASTATVNCSIYDWTSGKLAVYGTFNIADLADQSMLGTWNMYGGTCNVNNGGEAVDLNASINLALQNSALNIFSEGRETYMANSAATSISIQYGILNFANNGLRMVAGANPFSENITAGTIKIHGSFICERTEFHPTGGTLEFTNFSNSQVSVAAGSSLYSFKLNMGYPTNSLNLTGKVTVKGNLNIIAGVLAVPDTLTIYGSWTNSVGTDGFDNTGGAVQFAGSNVSYIYGEEFNTLIINKTGTYNYLYPYGTVTCQNYLVVSGGIRVYNQVFTAYNLVNNCVAGYLYCDAGSVINLHNEDGGTDLAGNVIISSGLLRIYGNPAEYSNWGYQHSGSISMDWEGSLEIHQGLCLYPADWQNGEHAINYNITGGNLQVFGDYICYLTDFSVGTLNLELKGDTDSSIYMAPGTNSLYKLIINKTATSSATSVYLVTNVTLTNALVIEEGQLDLYGNTLSCGSTSSINAGAVLNMSAGSAFNGSSNINVNSLGELILGAGATLSIEDGKTLAINSGAKLSALGSQNSNCLFTGVNGNFYFTVNNGGTISARHCVFEHTRTNGVNINSTAIVDTLNAFKYCTFRHCYPGGQLLTISNSQSLSILGASFQDDSGDTVYNVYKTNNSGRIRLISALGDHAGTGFERDLYNRVDWINYDLLCSGVAFNNANPICGDQVSAAISISSVSSLDLYSPITVKVFFNRANCPELTDQADYALQVNDINPGTPFTYTLPDITCYETGIWNYWILIDSDNSIAEINEQNNFAGPYPVTWNSLPEITGIRIEKTLAAGYYPAMQITWDYPVWASYFKVYRSENPNFVPDASNLITTLAGGTYGYLEYPLNPNRMFYKVIAERTP
jgi:M6 family metalloprotease-like protein